MGHGDEIAVVDANFPAESCARRLVRMDGAAATDVLDAVVSVLPIDTYVECAVNTMAVVDKPDETPPIVHKFRTIIARREQNPVSFGTLARESFYSRSRAAFAIVATGEFRLYGNILLTKGVVPPSDTSWTPWRREDQ